MSYFNVENIKYEGPKSTNPLSFKYYDKDEVIAGKPMKEHLRFAMSYWHTLAANGADPFGVGTYLRAWDGLEGMELAKERAKAGFELMQILGIEYYCFHDVDIAPEGNTLKETLDNLDEMVDYLEKLQKETGIKLLWATSNMFSHPRFVHGAATSCNAEVLAYCGAKVKKMLEVANRLGAENYVFWGGREGYETLLNTNMKLELDNLARFLKISVDYAKEIGFGGQFLIEPKPKEPTKHQYDFDTATVLGFLRKYGLEEYFKMNIEANHATLAGHSFQHELHTCRINNVLGSIDANQGDMLLGWDTDQFPTNIYDAVLAMYEVLKNGGIAPGGLNFDAKLRRGSFQLDDLLYGYISGMDNFAKGLRVAAKLLEDGVFEQFVTDRYKSFTEGIGKDMVEGKVGLKELAEYAMNHDQIVNESGRQELLETVLNDYIYNA